MTEQMDEMVLYSVLQVKVVNLSSDAKKCPEICQNIELIEHIDCKPPRLMRHCVSINLPETIVLFSN